MRSRKDNSKKRSNLYFRKVWLNIFMGHIISFSCMIHYLIYLILIYIEMKRQRLLKRLSNVDHQSRHRKLCKTRHENTGTWILKAKQYLEWTSKTGSCCLWCYGIRELFALTPSSKSRDLADLIV
jgi:hypothetical protein